MQRVFLIIMAILLFMVMSAEGRHHRQDGGLDMRHSENRNGGYNMRGERDGRYNDM